MIWDLIAEWGWFVSDVGIYILGFLSGVFAILALALYYADR